MLLENLNGPLRLSSSFWGSTSVSEVGVEFSILGDLFVVPSDQRSRYQPWVPRHQYTHPSSVYTYNWCQGVDWCLSQAGNTDTY
jgi:hypothetical protein